MDNTVVGNIRFGTGICYFAWCLTFCNIFLYISHSINEMLCRMYPITEKQNLAVNKNYIY